MIVIILMGISILALMIVGMPIGLVLAASGLFWLALIDPNLIRGAAFAVWNTASNDVLISIPLFVLMGEIIQRAGIARRFYNAISLWIGWLPGGLLHANISACAIFSAVSGSSIATAASIGKAAIPDLLRLGYRPRSVYGSLAAGGTLGILIPPSIPLIIYSALVEVSLGRLFLAALFPGLMIALIFHLYILAVAGRGQRPTPEATEARQSRLASIGEILPLLAIIAVVLGGIYYAGASVNEVAGIGIAISLLVAVSKRSIGFAVLRDALLSTARITGVILFVVIGAQIFSFAVFSWGVNWEVSAWVGGLELERIWILLIIIGIYLILGMFIDAISMLVLTITVVFPIIANLGYDPIWFGIVLVLVLEIGLITPPVGLNLFTIQSVDPANIRFGEVTRGALPYALLLLAGVALLVAFPQIALWLPSTMSGR